MNAPSLKGPVDYTELVYPLFCLSVAELIKQDVRDGKTVDPEAVAWASRWEFLPHVDVTITERAP